MTMSQLPYPFYYQWTFNGFIKTQDGIVELLTSN